MDGVRSSNKKKKNEKEENMLRRPSSDETTYVTKYRWKRTASRKQVYSYFNLRCQIKASRVRDIHKAAATSST